jgi:hypothetical protein
MVQYTYKNYMFFDAQEKLHCATQVLHVISREVPQQNWALPWRRGLRKHVVGHVRMAFDVFFCSRSYHYQRCWNKGKVDLQ